MENFQGSQTLKNWVTECQGMIFFTYHIEEESSCFCYGQVNILRDWSLITGIGGYKMGE